MPGGRNAYFETCNRNKRGIAVNLKTPEGREILHKLVEGADVVIEAVGSVATLNQSMQMARPVGNIAVFGLPPTMERVPFDWDTFFRKRLEMHSVFGAQDEPGLPAFQLAVDYIAEGNIDMAPFVTHKFPIEEVQTAFDLADSKEDGALKVSLTF